MIHIQNRLIFVVVNDALDHWCDYATQTIRYLSQKNTVIVFASGDCITWRNVFSSRRKISVIEYHGNKIIYHPFFIVPGQRIPIVKKINYALNAFIVHTYISVCIKSQKKIFWFFDPLHIRPIFDIFSDYQSLYDCVDYYPDVSKELALQDRYLITHATNVFANSYTLAKKIRQYRANVTVVPLGFAFDIFQKVTVTKTKKHTPVIGFVGGITYRIDYTLLTAVAKQCPTLKFVFYGSPDKTVEDSSGKMIPDVERFFSLKNVAWKGFVPKRAIPNVIHSFDVCLIPYITTDTFNQFSFPMKVMEYFYMGKPILSTPIDELKRFSTYIYIRATASQWVDCLHTLTSSVWPTENKRKQRKIAEKNSWDNKLSQILRTI